MEQPAEAVVTSEDPREVERRAIISGIYGIMRTLTECIAAGAYSLLSSTESSELVVSPIQDGLCVSQHSPALRNASSPRNHESF
jgi:hypothetical protein